MPAPATGALTLSDVRSACGRAAGDRAEAIAGDAASARREALRASRWAALCVAFAAVAFATLPGVAAPLFTSPGPAVLTGVATAGLLGAALWFRSRRDQHRARWRRHLAALVTAGG